MKRVRGPLIQYDGRALVSSHGSHIPRRVVLHDTESHDHEGVRDLRGIAEFFSRQDAGYGYQVLIDSDGNSARLVNDTETAWGAAGANDGTLHLSLIGFASFTRDQWWKRPRQLMKCARWIAWWNLKWGIPIRFDTERGVSRHADHPKGGHHDPGAGFPFGFVLYLARTLRRFGW